MIKEILNKNETIKPNTKEIDKLKYFFPYFFNKQGNFKIDDFKKMLELEEIELEKEGYELQFLGKNYAKLQTSTESETVIVPDNVHNLKKENINSENIYIIGDNIDALKHLSKSYNNKIKCIYIDPPYNTGSDNFIYNDNFSFTPETLATKMGIDREEAERIINLKGKSNHSAWLTFMYSRLTLAQSLLTQDGIIFISIDDNEKSNLKLICDEIFGEANFVSDFIWINNERGRSIDKFIANTNENILAYAKNIEFLKVNEQIEEGEELLLEYNLKDNKSYYKKGDPLFNNNTAFNIETRPNLAYSIYINKKTNEKKCIHEKEKITDNDGNESWYLPSENLLGDDWIKIIPPLRKTNNKIGCWRWGIDKFMKEADEELILEEKNGKYMFYSKNRLSEDNTKIFKYKNYIKGIAGVKGTKEVTNLLNNKIFDNPKPLNLIKLICEIGMGKNDIILDFFSGSGTTAHSVMKLNAEDNGNRKFIVVQLPQEIEKKQPAFKEGYRTIDEIGRTRIINAGKIIKEENSNVDCGFKLFKLKNLNQKSLDKIANFDPNIPILLEEDYIKDFSFENVKGEDTILTTWLNQDGYGLNPNLEKIKLINYEIPICENSAYIINLGITSEDIIKLIELIEENQILINRIVCYPYSIPFNIFHEIRENIKQLHNRVELIERY